MYDSYSAHHYTLEACIYNPDPDPGPGRQIFIKIDPGRVRAGKRFSCKPGFIVILAKL